MKGRKTLNRKNKSQFDEGFLSTLCLDWVSFACPTSPNKYLLTQTLEMFHLLFISVRPQTLSVDSTQSNITISFDRVVQSC